MQKEIEAKFLRQDHGVVRDKLSQLGATCKYPMKLIHRAVFDYPDRRLQKSGSWVRLREELDGTIEVMLKRVAADKLGETYEYPVVVSNFDAAKEFLLSLGLEVKGEQESKREVWVYDGAEIMLDEWPWVDPFIEIEAPNEAQVKKVSSGLSLNWSEAKFGGVTPVYVDKYKVTKEEFEALELSMRFNKPAPTALVPRSTI